MESSDCVDIQLGHNAVIIGESHESSEVLSELWLWIRRTFLLALTAFMFSLMT